MSREGKPPAPVVQVVRRPAAPSGKPASPSAPRPLVSPTVKPVVAPAPRAVAPGARTTVVPVTPTSARAAGSASTESPKPRGAFPPRRTGRARPPATPEAIAELARRERVPARIAKGDLEGKMPSRIWRKKHPEEAARFDEAYALMKDHPALELAEAFGVAQSGLSVEEFMARRQKSKRRELLQEARKAVSDEAVQAVFAQWKKSQSEFAFVLASSTVLDVLKDVGPLAFFGERTGEIEKLSVVAVMPRTLWEATHAASARDEKLRHKPLGVQREPERRPFADPRPFLPLVGSKLSLKLRNGLLLNETLAGVGAFDLVLGASSAPLLVPLHAIVEGPAFEAPTAAPPA